MEYRRIEVRDRKGIYDSVAESLKKDIRDLGIKTVRDVEYIQVYTLGGSLNADKMRKVAEEILTDKVSQEYNSSGGFNPKKGSRAHVVEIAYNPGVMDPVEESTMKAIRDLGIKGVTSVSTSKKYIFSGKLAKKQAGTITEKLLYNRMIQHVVTIPRKRRNSSRMLSRLLR